MNQTGIYPTFWQAVGLLVAFVVLQVVFGSVTLVLQLGMAESTIVGNVGAASLVLLWGVRRTGRSVHDVLPLKPFSIVSLVPLVVLVVGLHILLSEVDNITRWFLPVPDSLVSILAELLEGSLANLLVLVVVAPVTEELICRGLVLGGFARNYSPGRAIIWSALLFAAVHLNPYQFASALVLGLLMGWLFLKTGSLWPCIIAHALANGISWVMYNSAVLEIPGYTSSLEGPVVFQPLWFDGLGVLLVAVGWVGLTASLKGENAAEPTVDAHYPEPEE